MEGRKEGRKKENVLCNDTLNISSSLPTAKFIESFMDFVQIQWNPSELDTNGRKEGRRKMFYVMTH